MHTIYSYSGSDFAEFRRTYAEVVRQEYYEGDLEMEVDRKSTRLKSCGRNIMRATWKWRSAPSST